MEEERHNNPAGITFRKNPGIIETGVDGVEIIDDSQIPPEKLEKIGRNLKNSTLLREWLYRHSDEIFNASPGSNYALAIINGDFGRSQNPVFYHTLKGVVCSGF